MNFITYINHLSVLKTALIDYNPLFNNFTTQSTIDEQYLVTSVFIGGVKRKISKVNSAIQLAVVNDNNFDGNLINIKDYNTEGTYFSASVIPDQSSVNSSVSKPNLYGIVRPDFYVRSEYYQDNFINSFYPKCASDPLKKMLTVFFDSVSNRWYRDIKVRDGLYYSDFPIKEEDTFPPTSDSQVFKIDDINICISNIVLIKDHGFTFEIFPSFNLVIIRPFENKLRSTEYNVCSTLTDVYQFEDRFGVPTFGIAVNWKEFPVFNGK